MDMGIQVRVVPHELGACNAQPTGPRGWSLRSLNKRYLVREIAGGMLWSQAMRLCRSAYRPRGENRPSTRSNDA